MTYLDSLVDERNDILVQVRDLAKAAEARGGFTDDERKRADDLLAKAREKSEEIKKAREFQGTLDDISGAMKGLDGDDWGMDAFGDKAKARAGMATPKGKGALAARFQKSLFGSVHDQGSEAVYASMGVGSATRRDDATPALNGVLSMNTERLDLRIPTDMDPAGWDHRTKAAWAAKSQAIQSQLLNRGRISVPILTDQNDPNGGGVILLPEFGGTILGLLPKPALTSGDEYEYRRMVSRDEDAAGFVGKGSTKPSTGFSFERVKDRVRLVAVLSDPMSVLDLADIPGLQTDVARELANRCIYRLEDAVLNGEQIAAGDTGSDGTTVGDEDTAEAFNGLRNTSGIREQAYVGTSADTGSTATRNKAATIRRSITTLETAGYDPDQITIVMSPTQWEEFELATDDEGRPLYPNLYTARQQPVLFGRSVVISKAAHDDEAWVANWNMGVLTLRTEIDLAWSDGGSDLFDKNMVKFRGEVRAGFNAVQPGAFVHTDLTVPAA